MPSPPPADQEFVVSIAIPGPTSTQTQVDNFQQFKKACNELPTRSGARVTAATLHPKPKS